MASIFLSYSREDQPAAKAIARLLEKAGHSVWWDPRIVSGHEFAGEIEAALERADLVLVAWSQSAARSPWVRDEAAIGRDSGRLLPVLLDGEQPPIGFRQFQALDLSKWNRRGSHPAAAALLAAVDARVDGDAGPDTTTVGKVVPRQSRFSAATLRIVAAMALVVAVAAAAFLYFSSRGTEAEEPIIAVLPFSDLSPGGDKAYLAEGVAEEILSTLGRNADLKVLGRTTSWALRDRASDPAEIRSALGVTHLLEGSVRAAGQDLRLSVRLIATKDGAQQWSEEYRGHAGDVFALQDRVAAAVAKRLTDAVSAAGAKSASQMTGAEAYNLYLAARQIARTRTEPELRRAFNLARQVVAAQPDFAPGHALMAELLEMLSDDPNSYGTIPTAKARPLARAHARKAIALAPNSADGHAALGLVSPADEAIPHLRRAIELDPARSELPLWLALQLDVLGRHNEAIEQLRRAVAIDPLFSAVVSRLSVDLSRAGRFDEAAQVVRRFEAQGGDPAQAARFRTGSTLLAGDLSGTVRWGERALRLNPDIPYVAGYVRHAYWQMGLPSEAARTPSENRLPLRQAFFSSGYEGTIAAAAKVPDLWAQPDLDFYVFALAAKRDWQRLIRFYDSGSMPPETVCDRYPATAISLAVALKQAGREAEARKLLECLGEALEDVQLAGPRHPFGVGVAEWLALNGRVDEALGALDRATRSGWYEYSTRLADFPALDVLAGHREYALAQQRLNQSLLRERRETLGNR